MKSTPTDDELGLRGRCILVTGAGRGLGRAYALSLARMGARVAVHDAGVGPEGEGSDPDPADSVVGEIESLGGSALILRDLLTDKGSCDRIVAAALEHFGRLDGLIHNAGLVAWRDTASVDEALYRRLTAVNSDAAFWLCAAALPAMREAGFGRILLTTSGWALQPAQGSGELTLYCHGKGAQFGLAMALAHGTGHPDILCNLLSPVAKTRVYRGAVPEDRLRPQAVAGAATWLVSPACRVSGCLIKAQDGTLALSRLTESGRRDLGIDAEDPIAAGRALAALAEAEAGLVA